MSARFISIWFSHLATDWFARQQPELKHVPFALRIPLHGRMIVFACNNAASSKGIYNQMTLADARAIVPDLIVLDHRPGLLEKLLSRLAEWCIRFTPSVSIDLPDGLLLDATGCSHLWGGDTLYVAEISKRLAQLGYEARVSMADTIGTAWAVARYGSGSLVVEKGKHINALMSLPPEALRLETETIERLHKLGLHQISQLVKIPRKALQRRFGEQLISRLNSAFGEELEMIKPIIPVEPYLERLPCLEPIVTATGIEIALKQLLNSLCQRLQREQKGVRLSRLKCYRVDGKVVQIEISTGSASHHLNHLYKLFEVKLPTIEPALGIELFQLEANQIEECFPQQQSAWNATGGLADDELSEFIDRIRNKFGQQSVHRYLPDEHYWPERAIRSTASLLEEPTSHWRKDKPRPILILPTPQPIEVTAPIPDYPPMLFRYKDKVHQIIKADGPERIEQEWWIQQGQHRDYYYVEDAEGHRYWLFRLGHYHDKSFKWFLHGYFA